MSSYEPNNTTAGTQDLPAFVPDRASENIVSKAFLSFLAPLGLAVVLTFTAAYPTPGDLARTIFPPDPEKKVVMTGADTNVEAVVTELSRQASTAAGAYADRAASDNCFSDLANSTKAKLDRCSESVYMALVEVQKNVDAPRVMQALGTPDKAKLVSNLQLAAAEVCRLRWTRGGDAELNNPACEVSGLPLVSQN